MDEAHELERRAREAAEDLPPEHPGEAGLASPALAPERPSFLPDFATFLKPSEPFLLPLALLLFTRGWFWKLLPFASEDAYITFRYSRNLVVGYGLVYNPGERVMGFTSPPWTLWNALGIWLMHDPVIWSRATTMALEALALLIAGTLLSRHAGRVSAWCFNLFFAGWPFFAAIAISGMENSAMFCLMLLAAALAERRSAAAGLGIAAVALMRPEGLVAALLIGLIARNRDRVVAASLVATAWIAMTAYYGSPIPQSLLAKAHVYGTHGPWSGRHWWEWVCPFPFGAWPSTSEGSVLFAMAVLMAPALWLGTLAAWKMRGAAIAHAFAAAAAVWVGYSVMGVAYFAWYLAVPLAGVAGLAAIGLPRLVRGRAAYVSLALFVAGTWTVVPELYRLRARAEMLGFGAAAEYLVTNARAGEKVLLEPIGMVGWRCRMVVRDEIGLVTPPMVARRMAGAGWMSDYVAAERPDWIVVRRGVLASGHSFAGAGDPFRGTAERDSLMARYAVGTVIMKEEAGDNALTVLRRKDRPLAIADAAPEPTRRATNARRSPGVTMPASR